MNVKDTMSAITFGLAVLTGCGSLDKSTATSTGLAAANVGSGDRRAAITAGATGAALAASAITNDNRSGSASPNASTQKTSADGARTRYRGEDIQQATTVTPAIEPPKQAVVVPQKDNVHEQEHGDGRVVWKLGGEKIETCVYSTSDPRFNYGKYVLVLSLLEGIRVGEAHDVIANTSVAFKSLDDLEYALCNVSNFLVKAAQWQKIAIEKDIPSMTKDDEKTHIILDKNGERIENFTFTVPQKTDGQSSRKCRIYVKVKKQIGNMGRFRDFVMEGTVDSYTKHIEKAFEAVKAFKADVKRRKAEKKKLAETAELLN